MSHKYTLNSYEQDTVMFSLVYFLEKTGKVIGEVFCFSLADTETSLFVFVLIFSIGASL